MSGFYSCLCIDLVLGLLLWKKWTFIDLILANKWHKFPQKFNFCSYTVKLFHYYWLRLVFCMFQVTRKIRFSKKEKKSFINLHLGVHLYGTYIKSTDYLVFLFAQMFASSLRTWAHASTSCWNGTTMRRRESAAASGTEAARATGTSLTRRRNVKLAVWETRRNSEHVGHVRNIHFI